MRIRIIMRTVPPQPAAAEMFAPALLPAKPGLGALMASLAAHAVLIPVLPLAGQFLDSSSDRIDWTVYRVQFMRLKVPDPIFYTAENISRKPDARPDRPAKAPTSGATPGEGRRAPAVPADDPSRLIRKGLELPSTTDQPETKMNAALLQPDFVLNPPKAETPPPLAFWARQGPLLPKAPLKKFVVPGRKEQAAAPPQMDAPPVLAVPNQQAAPADINVALTAPLQQTLPALPVPNSTTAPVRDKNGPPRPGAMERAEGDPANVIAVSPVLVPPGQVISVPQGLRNLPRSGTPGGGESASTAAEKAKPAGEGSGASNQRAASGRSGSATPKAAAQAGDGAGGNGKENGKSSAPGASAASNGEAAVGRETPRGGMTASAAATGNGSPHGDSSANPAPARPPAAPGPSASGATEGVIRHSHPVNGNFDVIITQSTPTHDGQDFGSMLTGNPVYTVYLQVGDRKEWMLLYCVPGRDPARGNPYQVFVGDAAPVAPPYPVATAIPGGILEQKHSRDIVFHGFLTATGSFRDLSARENSNPLARQIAPLLAEWRFRPAAKDRVPTEVEVVLVVPAGI